jgi:Zn-dependent protease with chaperone function
LAEFSNPRLPQEVNNSDERPLRSLLAMGAAALGALGAAAAALIFAGAELARFVPYEAEARLIAPHAARFAPSGHPAEVYLQRLAARLARGMALPEGMTLRVHYVNEPGVNAFATLGGHIAVYRGLLERVPDENVLAMVLAHEIGHAALRHPIRSLGRGVALGAAITLVSAGAGGSLAESVLGNSGMLTMLTFSRAQEEDADAVGIEVLVRAYGHAGGALETFRILQAAAAERGRAEPPKFLSTHPLSPERIARLDGVIRSRGWAADGERTPVPAPVSAAVRKDAQDSKAHRPPVAR